MSRVTCPTCKLPFRQKHSRQIYCGITCYRKRALFCDFRKHYFKPKGQTRRIDARRSICPDCVGFVKAHYTFLGTEWKLTDVEAAAWRKHQKELFAKHPFIARQFGLTVSDTA